MPGKMNVSKWILTWPEAHNSTANLWRVHVDPKSRNYFRFLHRADRARRSDSTCRSRHSRRWRSGRWGRRGVLFDGQSANKSVAQRPSVLHGRRFILKEQVTLQENKMKSHQSYMVCISKHFPNSCEFYNHRQLHCYKWTKDHNIPYQKHSQRRWN